MQKLRHLIVTMASCKGHTWDKPGIPPKQWRVVLLMVQKSQTTTWDVWEKPCKKWDKLPFPQQVIPHSETKAWILLEVDKISYKLPLQIPIGFTSRWIPLSSEAEMIHFLQGFFLKNAAFSTHPLNCHPGSHFYQNKKKQPTNWRPPGPAQYRDPPNKRFCFFLNKKIPGAVPGSFCKMGLALNSARNSSTLTGWGPYMAENR